LNPTNALFLYGCRSPTYMLVLNTSLIRSSPLPIGVVANFSVQTPSEPPPLLLLLLQVKTQTDTRCRATYPLPCGPSMTQQPSSLRQTPHSCVHGRGLYIRARSAVTGAVRQHETAVSRRGDKLLTVTVRPTDGPTYWPTGLRSGSSPLIPFSLQFCSTDRDELWVFFQTQWRILRCLLVHITQWMPGGNRCCDVARKNTESTRWTGKQRPKQSSHTVRYSTFHEGRYTTV